jgi:SAM-dependent methyltransferase
VGRLYDELGVNGRVLDLMSSWISHFRTPPASLTVLGMNGHELARNRQARNGVVHDLNAAPGLPFRAGAFDDAVCCVSVDYLVRPVEVFTEVARVLGPGGRLVCTFSNRLFPTKAVRGWLYASDEGRCRIVSEYFRLSGWWEPAAVRRCTAPEHRGDPLFAVWAVRSPGRGDGASVGQQPLQER